MATDGARWFSQRRWPGESATVHSPPMFCQLERVHGRPSPVDEAVSVALVDCVLRGGQPRRAPRSVLSVAGYVDKSHRAVPTPSVATATLDSLEA
eukprot:4461088-Alexandrium_andersonii.AAC.1